MGHLFYVELGSAAGNGSLHNANYNLFTNLTLDQYWSATPVATLANYSWQFNFLDGNQYVQLKTGAIRAMAVHPGDIGATVPVPAAGWLAGAAARARRRKH